MVLKRSAVAAILAFAMMLGFAHAAFATTYGPIVVQPNSSKYLQLAPGDQAVYILPNTGQTTLLNVSASISSTQTSSLMCYYSAVKGGTTINLGSGTGGGGVSYLSPGEIFIIRVENTSSSTVSYTINFSASST